MQETKKEKDNKDLGNVFVVAEIGVNHNGDVINAANLMIEAIDAGTDAVKFQLWEKNKFPEIEHLRLSKDDMIYLKKLCYLYSKSKGVVVEWFCTAFDKYSFAFVRKMCCGIYKIPSNAVVFNDRLLLRNILNCSLQDFSKVFLSTGILKNKDILWFLKNRWFDDDKIDCTFLHCVSMYPTPTSKINLKRINELRSLGCSKVGYSDHSGRTMSSINAVNMGAEVIEVHITKSKNLQGPDHKSSLSIMQFKSLVKRIREIERRKNNVRI